jgi:geranylgeranyl diphosphate synthase, type II
MINTELQLEVPVEKEVRHTIRRKTEEYFSQKHIMPPVYYDDLSGYASDLIRLHNWDDDFKAFVMVCCGNAIWQPVVSSIPYNRRILLLPQCMKSSRSCQGEQDELGLLCSACGNCSISGLLNIAEELGYVTIVSEGTTVTTRLVEEGKADAIIGVSCMEVLQKMFASVSKYAVPGIGIPLLYSGCKDTKTDIEWIKEEIYRFDEGSAIQLLNLNYLRNKTASVFTEEQLNNLFGAAKNSTEELIREYILTGGKRLRPLLTILAYEAFSKQSSPHNLTRLALSIECFHKASLIHDDIEDNDQTRYGKETLHAKYGVPVAINAGDLLIGEGYRLITETSLSPQVINKCIRAAAEGHRLLSTGQGMELMAVRNREILTLHETLTVFDYKAATAFKVALLLGAIAGEADEDSISGLEQFSHNIGIAYQIMDDMEDFTNPKGEIDLNKSSIFISLLSERLTPQDQVLFQGAYYSCDAGKIKHFIEKYQIKESAEELLRRYLSQTKACLANFGNPGLKLALHEILGKIFNDYI